MTDFPAQDPIRDGDRTAVGPDAPPQEPRLPQSDPGGWIPDPSPLLLVLERAYAAVHGVPADPKLVQRVSDALERSLARGRNWQDAVVEAVTRAEMHATPATFDLRDVQELVHDGAVAVTKSPDGAWLIAAQDRRGRPRVCPVNRNGAAGRPWTFAEATARLGSTPLPWVEIENSLPLGGLGHCQTDRGFERVRRLVRLERRDLGVVLVYAMVSGGLSLSMPAAVQALVSWVALGAVLQPLVILTLLLAAFLVFDATMRALQTWVVEQLEQRMFARVASDFVRRLPRVDPETASKYDLSALMQRFLDVAIVQKTSATILVDGLAIILTVAVGALLLALYHPFLLVFAFLLVSLLLAIMVGWGRFAIATAREESSAKYEVADFLQRLAHDIPFLVNAASRRMATVHGENLTRAWVRHRRNHFHHTFRQHIASLGLYVTAAVTLLGVGGALVISAQLSLGQLVAAELVLTIMGASVMKVSKPLGSFYDLIAAMDKLGKIVDLPLTPEGGTPLPGEGPARLTFRNITIARGSVAFSELDLDIEAGEHLWVRGPAGCGKSLLLDVMSRRVAPDAGEVAVDGIDLRFVDQASAADCLSLAREASVLGDDLFDDLRWVAPGIDEAEAMRLFELVGLADVIRRLPDGMATEITPSGHPLSSSQLHRLTLARAMASAPNVLLLDGTLDHIGLEGIARRSLLEYVFSARAPWTVVVVGESPDIDHYVHRRWTLPNVTDHAHEGGALP
jgi:ABC-type bacteriocin/lantibiotic exporter with double-glycine peptidase domain